MTQRRCANCVTENEEMMVWAAPAVSLRLGTKTKNRMVARRCLRKRDTRQWRWIYSGYSICVRRVMVLGGDGCKRRRET